MSTILLSANSACRCGSGDTYGVCCGLWHAGLRAGRFAPTPEALMRARYCAYVLNLEDYLLATWHSSTAPKGVDFGTTQWQSLTVHLSETDGHSGRVEFVAAYKDNGRFKRLHELSHFVFEGGRWFYVHGDILA